ncbi:hypothetical protein VPH35_087701 [Triticum aestivum]
MKDAVVSHATLSASVEVDAPETNLSKEDSRSSDMDSKHVRGGTPIISRAGLPPRRRRPHKQSIDIPNAPTIARSSRDESGYVPASTLFPPPGKSNVMEKPEDRSTTELGVKPGTGDGGERPEQTASLPSVENPSINLRTSKLPVNVGVPYNPNKKIVKKAAADTADNTPRPMNKPDDSAAADSDMFVDLSPLDSALQVVRGPASTPEEISPSLDEVYHMIEEATLQRSSSRGQGQSSSNVPAEMVSKDTIRSSTPGSVRQQRVVHPPPADDYEAEVKATKEQNQLYDIVKQFENARASNKHMKELKS